MFVKKVLLTITNRFFIDLCLSVMHPVNQQCVCLVLQSMSVCFVMRKDIHGPFLMNNNETDQTLIHFFFMILKKMIPVLLFDSLFYMYFIVIYVNDIIFLLLLYAIKHLFLYFYISQCLQNFETVLELSHFQLFKLKNKD